MEECTQAIQETEEVRPEELIVEVYRQKTERTAAGLSATQVVMSQKTWRTIRTYHASLGTLNGNLPDYINKDSLFGLEIMLDNREGVKVL
jgi:hypothetical protein